MIRNGARMGLAPGEVWQLELWEYNMFAEGFREKQRETVAAAIVTGYYCAYYTNGGKKAKDPGELIRKLYAKRESREEGMAAIERVRKMEEERKSEERHG